MPTWPEVLSVALQLGYQKEEAGSEADQVAAFERAMKNFCRSRRRRFPTATQVLTVMVGLGYRRPAS